MLKFAFAKLNLGLQVLRKREDGFHEIKTCMYPLFWNDAVEVVKSKVNSRHIHGLDIPGEASSNLIEMAYRMLKEEFNLPQISWSIIKDIPIGAGMGGGSSDGTHALLILNELFKLNLSETALVEYAARLGSDCAFFLQAKAAIASGRGEKIEYIDLNLEAYKALIVYPQLLISTKEAYKGLKLREQHEDFYDIIKEPIERWQGKLINDFEASIFSKHEVLAKIKNSLLEHGAMYASMSGSGSTIFGIFLKDYNLKELEQMFSKNAYLTRELNLAL